MSFLLNVLNRRSTPSEITKALSDYSSYVESVRQDLPASAYAFATAPWHYDYADHRCPHDAWLESLMISEPSEGSRGEKREISIELKLLGAYQDGLLKFSYTGVRSYSLSSDSFNAAHGDWLADEIRLSDNSLVLHEILFRSGSRWVIESGDILVQWEPVASSAS